MTIQLKPEQDQLIEKAIEAGLIQGAGEWWMWRGTGDAAVLAVFLADSL